MTVTMPYTVQSDDASVNGLEPKHGVGKSERKFTSNESCHTCCTRWVQHAEALACHPRARSSSPHFAPTYGAHLAHQT